MSAVKLPSTCRIRRAMRELRRSGRRLVQHKDGWRVIAPAAERAGSVELAPVDVAVMAAEERLVEAEGGGYVLCAADMVEATCAPDAPASGPWVFEAAGVARTRAGGAGFEGLTKRARAGEGPLTLRQAAAGVRLVLDAEQSARAQKLTMDWDAVAVDRQRRSGRSGGLALAAREAAARIGHLKLAAGAEGFALAWSACVEAAPVDVIARRLGLSRREVHARLSEALEEIASAYER
jgi:hypothetical protein